MGLLVLLNPTTVANLPYRNQIFAEYQSQYYFAYLFFVIINRFGLKTS